jgi:hypothetical protein
MLDSEKSRPRGVAAIRISLLGVLLCLSTPLQAVPQRQTSPPTYLLRYKFRKGEELRYAIFSKVQSTTGKTQAEMKVLRVKGERAWLSASLLNPLIGLLTAPSDPSAGLHPVPMSTSVTYLVTSTGSVTPVVEAGGVKPSTGRVFYQSIVTETMSLLPSRRVKPGDEWPVETANLGLDRRKRQARARLESVEGPKGQEVARISLYYSVPVYLVLGDSKTRVSGDIGVSEVTTLSVRRGRVLRRVMTASGTMTTSTPDVTRPGSRTNRTEFTAAIEVVLTSNR